jgi:hypothetical protein
MDLARSRERQSVDHDWMKGTRTQQLEQRRHVGLEFLRVSRSAGRDAVEDGATAAEKEAQCAPQLESGQAEACGNQAFAADCHGLRPVTNEQPTGREACKRAAEMRTADRIEGDINAGAARGQSAHGSDEVTRAIVDRRCSEALNHRQVRRRTGANRLQAEVTRQIEQRRADRARGAYDENRGAGRQLAAASKHLKRGEVGKRDANRFGRIDAIGDRHEEARWADRILCIATDDTQISDHLALERCTTPAPSSRRRQRSRSQE